ncbi:hypothetical protein EZL74_00645 [Flavobacterium silvisoli]|uniref:Uncharacterized protein n=1 Tax=Flavobacterium silvisoli TaxID=2529433 RepID=A0A4Q9Z466_9FLAO|nr:hypothetical protein [Flavobacterium silvisoli]TBX71042.1 hypothetical protein EZL74_00645 [Flavobacterium silvisoli]
MKKRLEAELISIAHRILKLKNKSEVDQLYKETQKLYETLTVLKFYQDNFESVNADVAEAVLEEKLTHHLEETVVEPVSEILSAEPEKETEATVEVEITTASESAVEEIIPEEEEAPAPEVVSETTPEQETAEETQPETTEQKAPALAFQPIFELEEETHEEPAPEAEEETVPAETASEVTPDTPKVKVENFLSDEFKDPIFVKPNDVSLFATSATEAISEPKSPVIHESNTKSIAIGLNDRIGFVKHLFDESNEDFNRVLSQLNTFDSFEEAKNFIDDMVKPDYNNWQGNEDYAERFMELIANKFQ